MDLNSVEFEKLLKDQESKNQNLMLQRLKQYEDIMQEKDSKIQTLTKSLDNLKLSYKECCELVEERDKDITILESNYDNVLQIINIKDEEISKLILNFNKSEERNLEEKRNFQILEENYKIKLSKASCYNKEKLSALNIENENYRNAVQQLNETINFLNETNNDLNSKLKSIYNDYDNLLKEYDTSQKDLNISNSKIQNLENCIKESENIRNELNNEMSNVKKENSLLHKSEFELKLKLEINENMLIEKSNEIQLNKNKFKNIYEENMTLKIEKQNLEFQVKEHKENVNGLDKQIISLNEKVFSLIEEKSNLELSNSKLQNEMKNLKSNLSSKTNELDSLKEENLLIKEDIMRLKIDKDNAIKENKVLKEKVFENDDIVNKYNELKQLFEKNIIDKSNIIRENNELKEITERLTSRLSELNSHKYENVMHNIDANNINDNFNKNHEMYIVDSNNSVEKLNEYFLHSNSENNEYLDNIETFGERKQKINNNEIIANLRANLSEKINEISGLNLILQNIQDKITNITKEYEEEKEKQLIVIKSLEIELEKEKMNKNYNNELMINFNKTLKEENTQNEIKKLKFERDKLSNLCQTQRNVISKLENNLIYLKSEYDQYRRIYNEDTFNKMKSELYSRNLNSNSEFNDKSKFHSFNISKNNSNIDYIDSLELNLEERKKRILFRGTENNDSNTNTNKKEIDKYAKESLLKLNVNNTLPYTDIRKSSCNDKKRSLSGSKSKTNNADLSKTINIKKIVYDINPFVNNKRTQSYSRSRSNSNSRPKSGLSQNSAGKLNNKCNQSKQMNKKTFKLIK